jgi:hypothetical protein
MVPFVHLKVSLSVLKLKYQLWLNQEKPYSMTARSWNEFHTLIRPVTSVSGLGPLPLIVDVLTFFSPLGLFPDYFAIR